MKKLSLLMFAILILGCGNEKTVVEEPEPVIEEPPLVEPIAQPPFIADGTVKHGEVNVDPERLNREGLKFEFTEDISDYRFNLVDLSEWDGPNLRWKTIFTGWNPFYIFPRSEGSLFKYDTEYQLLMSFHDSDCEYINIVIQFRTKPQRPVVARPAPVIQERRPVAPLGERFQLDIIDPFVVAGDVAHGDDNVDPEPLNENGIQFEFDEDINRYKIDLRIEGGASLGWLPRDLVKNDMGKRIQITPAEGAPLLEVGTIYEIDIFVENLACRTNEFTIVFRTKPKP